MQKNRGGVTVGCGNVRPTDIGNNVFLGWGATVLAGSTIGDNVIIGAGSVVVGKVECNSVYAGNPAKRIMSIETYLENRKARQLSEAVVFFNRYLSCYGKEPDDLALGHYSRLYKDDTEPYVCEYNGKEIILPFESRERFEEFCLKSSK